MLICLYRGSFLTVLSLTADLLVDGFIARTFSSEGANSYIKHLLLEPPSGHAAFFQYYGISHHQGAWYITENSHLVLCSSPGVTFQPTPLLDYSTRAIHGTVVPQRRWTPADEVDAPRYVETLRRLPIFFVNRNGGLGFPLSDILRGCDRDLRNADDSALLGLRTTTNIRISVSLSPSHSY